MLIYCSALLYVEFVQAYKQRYVFCDVHRLLSPFEIFKTGIGWIFQCLLLTVTVSGCTSVRVAEDHSLHIECAWGAVVQKTACGARTRHLPNDAAACPSRFFELVMCHHVC